jgi:tetratricopeptide (TPR) repeat protein
VTESRPSRADAWIRIGLVVAAFAPFVPTLFYGFVYDDSVIILRNPVLAGWRSVVEVWKHPYWVGGGPDTPGLYRPVLVLAFAILANAAHKLAIAYHLFAVTLHACATLLVAKLLRRGAGRWPAAAGALWFAVHPVHVEAVASVANVSEVLVSVWTVLLALALRDGCEGSDPVLRAPGWGRSAVSASLYAAALLTKESGAVAPGLALIAAAGYAAPGTLSLRALPAVARRWWRVIVLWVAALGAVVVARALVLGGVARRSSFAIPGLSELDGPHRVVAVLSTGFRVARLLLWPTVQSPDYGPTALAAGTERLLAALATALTVVLLVLWSWRRAFRSERRDARPLAAIAWCLLAYLPASNLFSATSAILAERTLYLASIGVAMLLAWCIDELLALRTRWHGVRERADLGRALAATVLAAVAIVCARGYSRTSSYARIWRDRRSVFSQMVKADSLDYRGYQLLAMVAKDDGRYDDANALYARAYALRPFDETLLGDYAQYLLEVRRPRHALAIGQRLIRHPAAQTDPRAVTLFLNATSQVWGVDSVLASAARLNARAPSARAALFIGMAYDAKGDSAAARAAYLAGLEREPADSALRAHVWPSSPIR